MEDVHTSQGDVRNNGQTFASKVVQMRGIASSDSGPTSKVSEELAEVIPSNFLGDG